MTMSVAYTYTLNVYSAEGAAVSYDASISFCGGTHVIVSVHGD